jgi:SET family sugar efflux transporter-like MFS transporter
MIAVLLLGTADSITGPYLALFGADRAHLPPLAIGVFISVTGASGMAVSSWFGRRYDRGASRAWVLLSIGGAAAGFVLLTRTTSYPLLLIIAAVFLGTGTAAFPQLFALARDHLDGARITERGTPALRAMWSAAWAIGPMLGSVILARQGFTGLFLATAIAFGLVGLPVLLLGPPPAAGPPPDTTGHAATRPARSAALVVASFALFHTAMFAGSMALPLYVTEQMHRPYSDVGLMFSVCAAAEFLTALALTRLPAGTGKERLIMLGFVLFAGYFTVVAASPGIWLVTSAQAARGAAISIVLALGITYFQDLLPGQPGRATALLSNTAVAGSLASGVLAGSVAQAVGYRGALALCAILSTISWALLAAARRRR